MNEIAVLGQLGFAGLPFLLQRAIEHHHVFVRRVTRSSNKRLDQAAIDAVKRWKFKPAMRDDKPIAVLTSVEVDFRLY